MLRSSKVKNNLTDEYPNERSSRNLTLIAKTLQTLANFARYEGKENSMEFMNQFLDEESGNMRKFLELVSGPPPEDWIHGLNLGHDKSDLGRHLSALHQHPGQYCRVGWVIATNP